VLINDARFKDSRWIDNAIYNIATIHNTDALALADLVAKKTAFENALSNYNIVATTYAKQGLADHAANKIAMIYHDIGEAATYCTAELNWFNYNLTKTVDPLLISNANVHANDLKVLMLTPPGIPVNHVCNAQSSVTVTILAIPTI